MPSQCPLQAWLLVTPGRAILRPVMKCKESSIEYAPGRSISAYLARGQVLDHTVQSIAEPGLRMDAGGSRRGRS